MNVHQIVQRILEGEVVDALPPEVKKEIIDYDDNLRPKDPILAGINKIIEIKDKALESQKNIEAKV